MTGTPSAATDLSREILGEVLDERGKPGLDRQPPPATPATIFAEKVQAAIDQGASLDELRRYFCLSESELRDFCADLSGDDFDEDWSGSASGY